MIARLVGAAILVLAFAPAQAKAQEEGKQLYNNLCRTCHSIRPDDHRLGPSLAGVHGRTAGTAEGFPYSDAMRNAEIVWADETLDAFLRDPESVVRGNGMVPFGGIANEEDRAAVIAYLTALSP